MTNELVPLYHGNTKVTINYNIAELKSKQYYFNNKNEPIEAEYMLPSHSEVVISEIEIQYKDKVICARIEEGEAESLLDDCSTDKSLNMHTLVKSTKENKIVNLGSIPPKSEIVVTCTYYQALDVENLSWRLFVPAEITPRYIGDLPNLDSVQHHVGGYGSMEESEESKSELLDNVSEANRVFYQSLEFTWEFEVCINSSSPLTRIVSTSHDIDVNLIDDKENKALVKLKDLSKLNEWDFKLLYKNEEINKPMILTQKLGDEHALMISFLVDLAAKPESERKQQLSIGKVDMKQTIQYEDFTNVEIHSNEYYFVLDRSISMNGICIDTAKEALILFLRSLPAGSTFNVVSFGSDFEKMYPSTVEYNQENLDYSILETEKFIANLGGTDIYNPLEDIFTNIDKNSKLDKHVYLLTDGQVNNTQNVIKLIKQYSESLILHCIGIGKGVSDAFIVGTAKAGNGKYYFVDDKANGLEEVIIEALSKSFVPFMKISEHKVEVDGVLSIQSSEFIDSELRINHGDKFTYYTIVNELISTELEGSIKLKMFNPNNDEIFEFEFDLINQWKIEGNSIFKLIASKIIAEFTDANDKNSAISISTKYQVPSCFTSFFGAEKVINKVTKLVQYEKAIN